MLYNFEVRAGNTGTVKNDAGLELILKAGVPPSAVDLAADEFVFTVRVAPDAQILLRKASSDGGIILTPAEGRVLVPFSVADTRRLWIATPGARSLSLSYELERRRASPEMQRTVLYGTLTVIAGGNDD
jgi:hypothetical protein